MDLILELVVGLIVQLVLEVVSGLLELAAVEGAARALQSRPGRWGLTALFGLAVGAIWGYSLRDQYHLPRLLWVALAFAVLAVLVRLFADRDRVVPTLSGWRQLVTVPWRWTNERLTGLVFLNVALAGGVLLGYQAH